MANSHCSCFCLSSSSASSLSCKRGRCDIPFIRAPFLAPTFSLFSSSRHGIPTLSESLVQQVYAAFPLNYCGNSPIGLRSQLVFSAGSTAASSSSSPTPFEGAGGGSNDSNAEEPAEVFSERAWSILKTANSFLPQVVLASTFLALIFPPSFTWFTNRYYAPALGFLMFAVGINLNPSDFIHAFQRPWILAAGYLGQFVIKPLLGVLFATIGVSFLHLPPAIGLPAQPV